ncbi:DNA alkylation repair protein [Leptospira noguchii]|uniref:DNA alkylation repair protein n=1 Tax=Leptospira noguchii TaxID=28182 RepID=UPI001F058032|nr:DNA alkylation repair protein [Leptospira noguchii]MCH1912223.1 DNA alkylation repair protein [Leptospira noguchii]MCH1915899.1 DNA alkylation repair protein [Leptospira noguchii]UOG63326.1 DNA alkylation repair protein [Leptospira noguchii]
MDSIRSKKEIKSILAKLSDSDESLWIFIIESELLKKKIKFPLLEFIGKELYFKIPEMNQIYFMDQIIKLGHMGGYVISAIILQLRSEKHFEQSFNKAVEYILLGNEWYVCDIIGERIMGYFLLKEPERTFPILKKYIRHENGWIVRSVGVASHYAVKKGLGKKYVEDTFCLLLSKMDTKDFHTKKGIGWAVKTISKFHPDIIQKFESSLLENHYIQPFFRRKIEIGLSRSSKYASKYSN